MVSSTGEKEKAANKQQLLPVVRQVAEPVLRSLCSQQAGAREYRSIQRHLEAWPHAPLKAKSPLLTLHCPSALSRSMEVTVGRSP